MSGWVRLMVSEPLAGLSVRTVDGVLVQFVEPPDDGEAGVREPRGPRPAAPPAAVAAEVSA